MRIGACFAFALGVGAVVALHVGCGGDSFNSSGGGGAGAGGAQGTGGQAATGGTTSTQGTSMGTTGEAGSSGTSTSTQSGGTGGGGAGGTGGSTAGTGGGGGAPPCPNARGTYAMITHQGGGCGDIDDSATACVTSPSVCAFDAASLGSNANSGSINGSFDLMQDGTFSGAAIRIGSVQRTGCTGNFDAGVLTVVCGGSDPQSSQYCSVTLTRTGGACGQDPMAQIEHPSDGDTRVNTMPIPFVGTANDPQDGMLTGASLVWVDDVEGQIGTGNSFSATLPTPGMHTVTLTATDSDGNTGKDSITLNILAAP